MNIYKKSNIKELISKEKIAKRVKELGQEITEFYKDLTEPLVLVGILKGSIIFLSDLCREVNLNLEIEMMGVSSYGEATKSSGEVRITHDLRKAVKDRHILIIEDILDSGLTLKYLTENFKSRGPKSLKICCLLKKDLPDQHKVKVDWIGFNIPDEFVVGYGLDINERLRNLPMIGIYEN